MLTLWPGIWCGRGRGTGRFPGVGYSVHALAALPGATRSWGPRLSGGWRSAYKLSAANGISEWVSGEPGARPRWFYGSFTRNGGAVTTGLRRCRGRHALPVCTQSPPPRPGQQPTCVTEFCFLLLFSASICPHWLHPSRARDQSPPAHGGSILLG